MSKLKKYSPELKHEAADQILHPGVSCWQVAFYLNFTAAFLSR